MTAWLKRFRGETGGAALVEFVIVAPLLVAFVIGIIQYGGMIIAYNQMHDAVASGSVYVMRGGTSASTIKSVTTSAWPNAPSDAAVSVNQVCTCAGVNSTCSSLCADQSYPESFTTISASGTYSGLWGSQSMSSSQVVRTQ
jgi:Flp pilus assembly protein TadG